jgi:DNA sulfur modification protein DndE
MEPPIDRIVLTQLAKEQLTKLKRNTKINQCHALCRWGFCLSLGETTIPSPLPLLQISNLEITWHEFGGKFADALFLALKQRCYNDNLGTDQETLARQFYLHLHRGIGFLAGDPNIKKIADLIVLATNVAEV